MFPGLEVLETTSLNKDSHQEDFYLFLPRKILNSVRALGSPARSPHSKDDPKQP